MLTRLGFSPSVGLSFRPLPDHASLWGSISQNNWYHCIATFDANTHQQKLYINGLIIGVLSSSILQYSNQIGFIIGASLENSSGTLCDVFNGKLDDIGFWNRALNGKLPLNSNGYR